VAVRHYRGRDQAADCGEWLFLGGVRSVGWHRISGGIRIASEKLRRGDRGALFPEGCFPPALPYCT
jgi:hypothetical protein